MEKDHLGKGGPRAEGPRTKKSESEYPDKKSEGTKKGQQAIPKKE